MSIEITFAGKDGDSLHFRNLHADMLVRAEGGQSLSVRMQPESVRANEDRGVLVVPINDGNLQGGGKKRLPSAEIQFFFSREINAGMSEVSEDGVVLERDTSDARSEFEIVIELNILKETDGQDLWVSRMAGRLGHRRYAVRQHRKEIASRNVRVSRREVHELEADGSMFHAHLIPPKSKRGVKIGDVIGFPFSISQLAGRNNRPIELSISDKPEN